MVSLRRRVGFLRSVGQTSVASLLWPEGTLALGLGLGGGGAIVYATSVTSRITIVGDGIAVVGLLVGVVFVALSVSVALFRDAEYAKLLQHAEGGLGAFLRPFMIAIGCEVLTLFVGIGYRGLATVLPESVEPGAFLLSATLFSYSLLDIVALTRNLIMHALVADENTQSNSGTVRKLHDKSS